MVGLIVMKPLPVIVGPKIVRRVKSVWFAMPCAYTVTDRSEMLSPCTPLTISPQTCTG